MFPFQPGTGGTDPLRTRKAAADWFRTLPLDVIGRQQQVLQALDALRHGDAPVTAHRLAAIEFVDGALAADNRTVEKWYLDNLDTSPRLSDRFWQAGSDVAQGFIGVYGAALARAEAQVNDRRSYPMRARITARLMRHYAVDAKLHVFRGEAWIPAKYARLHALFLAAAAVEAERLPVVDEGDDTLRTQCSVESEYLHALLTLRLDTGNLTPPEIAWAAGQLRLWSGELALESAPRGPDGFLVDLAGSAGLARREGDDRGARVGYLDTSPLIARLDAALAVPEGSSGASAAPGELPRARRCAVLQTLRPVFAPRRQAELRRHPRIGVNLPADVRVGLAAITHDLAEPKRPPTHAAASRPAAPPDWTIGEYIATYAPVENAVRRPLPMADSEEIVIRPLPGDEEFDERSRLPESVFAPRQAPAARWQVRDRSVSSFGLRAQGDAGPDLTLGALVAVRPANLDTWSVGVVRRVSKPARDRRDAGMAVLSERAIPVSLHARRPTRANEEFTVDGVNASMLGARFSGLYLMPPASDAAGAPPARTMIIPTAEHVEGRDLILTTARSIYAITIGRLLEQRPDWSWVTIEVSARASAG